MPKLLFLLLLITIPYTLAPIPSASAQSADVSSVYNITDSEAAEGDIVVSTKDQGLKRATTAYDSGLFGVIHGNPLIVLKKVGDNGKPIARYGTAQVSVTTSGGNIKSGDYITSSQIPGKGQKATLSGYVIGIALASYEEKDTSKVGKIPVALKIEYSEITTPRNTSRFLGSLTSTFFSNVKDPDKFAQVFRYLAAGLIALASFALGFITFSRSVPKGIEAIGRNPLAEKAILFGVTLNIILTVITAAIGIAAAILIIRL